MYCGLVLLPSVAVAVVVGLIVLILRAIDVVYAGLIVCFDGLLVRCSLVVIILLECIVFGCCGCI